MRGGVHATFNWIETTALSVKSYMPVPRAQKLSPEINVELVVSQEVFAR